MSLAYALVDVFTDTALQGNQLAVFDDGTALDARQMQAIARELNLSETVFLFPPEAGGDARMRIFTPRVELPFAGHPVLGTAFVVAQARQAPQIRLETNAAIVALDLEFVDGHVVFGRMQQPIPTWSAFARSEELLSALGVLSSSLPVTVYENGPANVYVGLDGEAAVTALKPNMAALAEIRGVHVYCFAGSGLVWRARMFAPGAGINEDPATGSAAGPLAVHLARHGRVDFGVEIEIRQGEEMGRPSILFARASGNSEQIQSVEVGGAAVVIGHGVLERW